MKERTEALEKSENKLKNNLVETEKINKFMIGRELEMINLKKEIKKLKKDE